MLLSRLTFQLLYVIGARSKRHRHLKAQSYQKNAIVAQSVLRFLENVFKILIRYDTCHFLQSFPKYANYIYVNHV